MTSEAALPAVTVTPIRPAIRIDNEPDVVSRTAGQLAAGLANILTQAILDLQKHVSDDVLVLHDSVHRQQQEFAAAVQSLEELRERTNWLTATVHEQGSAGAAAQEKYEQLAADIAFLQQARVRQEDLSRSFSDRVDAILGRLDLQDRDLAALRSPVSDLSTRVDAVVHKLELQSGAFRHVHEGQTRWNAALDQVIEILTRARDSSGADPLPL